MTDTTLSGPQAVIERIGALLTERGADCDTDESGTMLALFGDAGVGRCQGIITAEMVETEVPMVLLQVGYSLPRGVVPERRWPALYELLALLSPHLTVGHFEFDHDVGELRWRAHQLLSDAPPWSDAHLMALAMEGIDTIDAYFESFTRVIDDGDDPNLVIAEAFLAINDESDEGYGELIESDLLRMLKTARRRAVGGDQATVERISALLLKLTE